MPATRVRRHDLDDSIQGILSEVEAARSGNASLLDRLNSLQGGPTLESVFTNSIRIAKTAFKINTRIQVSRERLYKLVVDVFEDQTGIDAEASENYRYHDVEKAFGPYFNWEQVVATNNPSARAYPVLVYDSSRNKVIMFGGRDESAATLNDTWEYDGVDWVQINTPMKPSARWGHAMAYDSSRNRVVMFGGRDAGDVALNDTWEYDGTNWVQIDTPVKPPARSYHAMAYDSARGKIVLFGGHNLNDTWEYDGTNWVQFATPTRPSPRQDHALAYDSFRGKVVLFGGISGSTILDDTWEYDGSDWVEIQTANKPSERRLHALAYRGTLQAVVLFGGVSSVANSDTWIYDGVNWIQIDPETAPSTQYGHGMTYDDLRDRVVIFGGSNGTQAVNTTWELINPSSSALLVSTPEILEEAPSEIYLSADVSNGVDLGKIAFEVSLDGGNSWFNVIPDKLIAVPADSTPLGSSSLITRATIPTGCKLSGWAVGWS